MATPYTPTLFEKGSAKETAYDWVEHYNLIFDGWRPVTEIPPAPEAVDEVVFRSFSEATWEAANPVLKDGEPAWVKDLKKLKIGDGVTEFADLDYFTTAAIGGGGGGGITRTPADYGTTGTSNDTAVIQAAIDDISANGGGVLLMDEDQYLAGGIILKDGVIMRSAAGSDIKFAGASAASKIVPPTGYTGWIIDTPNTGITNAGVIGMTIIGGVSGSGSPNVGGIRLKSGTWCTFSGNGIASTSLGSLKVNGTACMVANNALQNFTQFRTLTAHEGTLHMIGTDHWVVNNQVNAGWSLTDNVVSTDPNTIYANGVLAEVFTSWFLGGSAEFAQCGWRITALASTFTNIRSDTNAGVGIIVETGAGGGNRFKDIVLMGNCVSPNADGVLSSMYVRDNNCLFDGIIFAPRPGFTNRPRYALIEDMSTIGYTAEDFAILANTYRDLDFTPGSYAWDKAKKGDGSAFSFDGNKFQFGYPGALAASRFAGGKTFMDTYNNRLLVCDGDHWRTVPDGEIASNLINAAIFSNNDGAVHWDAYVGLSETPVLERRDEFKGTGAIKFVANSAAVSAGYAAIAALESPLFVPVNEGEPYQALIKVTGPVGKSPLATLAVFWFDSGAAFLGQDYPVLAAPVATNGSPPSTLYGNVTAPVGAAYATLAVLATASGMTAGDVFYVAKPTLLAGSSVSTETVQS